MPNLAVETYWFFKAARFDVHRFAVLVDQWIGEHATQFTGGMREINRTKWTLPSASVIGASVELVLELVSAFWRGTEVPRRPGSGPRCRRTTPLGDTGVLLECFWCGRDPLDHDQPDLWLGETVVLPELVRLRHSTTRLVRSITVHVSSSGQLRIILETHPE